MVRKGAKKGIDSGKSSGLIQRAFETPPAVVRGVLFWVKAERRSIAMAVSLSFIILFGLLAAHAARQLKIPGLVGMLLAGILCGPYVFDLMAPEMMQVSGDFRKIALIVILLRAGFELHRNTLHRVGRAALAMSTIPALFEIAGVVLVAPKLLNISWLLPSFPFS